MPSLLLTVDTNPASQGSLVSGTVAIDAEQRLLAAIRIHLDLPPTAFQAVALAPPAWASGIEFAASAASEGPRGRSTVVLASSAGRSGIVEICTFSATVAGLRGESYSISAEIVDGFDADGIPLDAPAAALLVRVEPGAPGLADPELPDGRVGLPYVAAVRVQGGAPPYVFDTAAVPFGLSMDASGVVSGIPTVTGASTFDVSLVDADGTAASGAVLLTVRAAPLVVSIDFLPAVAPAPNVRIPLSAAGGTPPFVWEVTGLPSGLRVAGSEIVGRVDPEHATFGPVAITLRVRDAEDPPQTAERTVDTVVLPAGIAAEYPVSGPGAVVVARDLWVAEYDVEISASIFVPGDDETRAALDEVQDEILAALLAEDHGVPGAPAPEGPGPTPPPGSPGSSEQTRHLLQEWRDLEEQKRGASVMSLHATLQIDGKSVAQFVRDPLRGATHGITRVPGVRALRRAERRRALALLDALGPDANEVLAAAREHVAARIRELRHPSTELRTSDAPKPIALDAPREELRGAALRRAAWLRQAVDWDLIDPLLDLTAAGQGTRITLTPGAHEVRVTYGAVVAATGGALGSGAGASVQWTARIAPVNPQGWPRLAGDTNISGGGGLGGTNTVPVQLATSALDVVVASADGLRIAAATLDPAAPYAAPVPFQHPLGTGTRGIAATTADAIGRTSLVAWRRGSVRVALNDGPGGFVAKRVPFDESHRVVQADFGAVTSEGRSNLVIATEESVVSVRGLAAWVRDGIAPTTVATGAMAPVSGDFIAAAAVSVEPAFSILSGGTRLDPWRAMDARRFLAGVGGRMDLRGDARVTRLVIAYSWTAALRLLEIRPDGTARDLGLFDADSEFDPLGQPVSLTRGGFDRVLPPGVAVVHRHRSTIEVWRRTGSAWTRLQEARLPRCPSRVLPAPRAFGGFLVVVDGGVVLLARWPSASSAPVLDAFDLRHDVRHAAAADDVVALSRTDADIVTVLVSG